MNARSAVAAVVSGQDIGSLQVATKAAVGQVRQAPASNQQSSKVAANDAAVSRQASEDAVRVEVATGRASRSDEAVASESFSREDAEKFASELQEALNSTFVRFNVSVKENKDSGLNFQVVDRESGRVIREFPAERVMDPDRYLRETGNIVNKTA